MGVGVVGVYRFGRLDGVGVDGVRRAMGAELRRGNPVQRVITCVVESSNGPTGGPTNTPGWPVLSADATVQVWPLLQAYTIFAQ